MRAKVIRYDLVSEQWTRFGLCTQRH
jgi:hypothetical protein